MSSVLSSCTLLAAGGCNKQVAVVVAVVQLYSWLAASGRQQQQQQRQEQQFVMYMCIRMLIAALHGSVDLIKCCVVCEIIILLYTPGTWASGLLEAAEP
jgi:hypothetical protein